MWTVSNDMQLDIDPNLSDQAALDLATKIAHQAVGDAAKIDIHRIQNNRVRVIIYVEEKVS